MSETTNSLGNCETKYIHISIILSLLLLAQTCDGVCLSALLFSEPGFMFLVSKKQRMVEK